VGTYNIDGRPAEPADIERMVHSIAHRGPDGYGVWSDGPIGMGHRMLWTTPECLHEKPPLVNETEELVITADARIDNREELFFALDLNGRPKETTGDTELILAAYERWGERCPEKLLGDFAFAIWDGRNRKIFCARDPFGIKPFFYYADGKTFQWSSEMETILENERKRKEPNIPLIILYLLNRFDEQEETLFRNIYRLPPAHSMVLENGHLRKTRYWSINPQYLIRYRTDEEYADQFLELFIEAMKRRLRSFGPVGTLLSGGLDSSSIACIAKMILDERLVGDHGFEAYSILFDDLACDERSYIASVNNKWNIKSNFVSYEKMSSMIDVRGRMKALGMSYPLSVMLLIPAISEARKNGARVLFHGVGGDDFLDLGFNYLTDLFRNGKFGKLIEQLKMTKKRSSKTPFYFFVNYCIKPCLPESIKRSLKWIRELFFGQGIPWWIRSSLPDERTNERLRKKVNGIGLRSYAKKINHEMFWHGWNGNVGIDGMERLCSHFHIDSRFPLLDKRLVEFLFAVPNEQWGDCFQTKVILRNAMNGILPEAVRERKDKADFACVFDLELKSRQSKNVEKLIRTSILNTYEIICSDSLLQLYENYRNGVDEDSSRTFFETFIWIESLLKDCRDQERGEEEDGWIKT
jgi:asparagine synthase (glutamine-hydrolysing)